MPQEEFQATYGQHLKTAPSAQDLSLKVIEIHENEAVILGGMLLKGVSGSRDRFTLKQANGKWVLVKREPYEIS